MFCLFCKKITEKTKELSYSKKYEHDILNTGMRLCLEWGENWLQPIDKRLKAIYPDISEDKAKEIDITIRATRDDIFIIIEQCYLKEITDKQAKTKIHEKYPFLNEVNIKHLFNQGMYYAWKDYG